MRIFNIRFIFWFVGIISLIFPALSWAYSYCLTENGWDKKVTTFNLPSQIIVPKNIAVGGVFYDNTIDFDNGGELFASCYDNYSSGVNYTNWLTADSNGVAQTNVAGVGIRMYFSDHLVPKDPMDTFHSSLNFYWGQYYKNKWRIQLIKTGAIKAGTLKSGSYAFFYIWNKEITTLNIGAGSAITSAGCDVTTPAITVPLGQRRKSDFTGVGSTTSWQDFNIGLTCDSGTRINVRIDATADSSAGTQGVMQLDKTARDSAATGVGIQMGYRPDNSLVQYGQEKFYQTSVDGDEIVQLRARYYQTAANITAGEANGTATFTLTYK